MNKRRAIILAAVLLVGLVLVLSADESSVVEGPALSIVEGLVTRVLAQGTPALSPSAPLGIDSVEGSAIERWVIGGGGGEASGAGEVVVNSTLGDPIVGPAGDGSVSLGAGYWYGAETAYTVYLPLVVKD